MSIAEFLDSFFFGWTAAVAVMVIGALFPHFKNKYFTIMVIAGWIGLNVFAAILVLRRIYE